MYEYLDDMDFLTRLDQANIRTHYARLTLLSFDEKPLKEIQGNVTSGTVSVNGSSTIRRTVSLSLLADEQNTDIENVGNDISVDKKVKVEVGLKNPFDEYDDIIWFPQGIYILTSANVSRSTSGWTISISGKDKMCLLDGTAGGTLPASTTFHEKWIQKDDGDYEILYPTIYQIIFEAVNHWGGISADQIIISDIDDTCKELVRYMGNKTIYFSPDYTSFSYNYNVTNYPNECVYNQDIGYELTDFTYPSDLILDAGDTVTDLLDKIIDALGNYEYFFDINGNFIFQQIKNYLNNASPLDELDENSYVRSYNNAKFLYSLTDLDSTTAITKSPKYDSIKNDFYVWGQREESSGATTDIRYHLAIDEKPSIDLAAQHIWIIKDKETGYTLRYEFNDYAANQNSKIKVASGEQAVYLCKPARIYDSRGNISVEADWREELYRRALVANVSTDNYSEYYYNELLTEWRKLYDPMKTAWQDTNYWNPNVHNSPSSLDYWLDFIDSGAEVGKYSVNQIGRRTKVINDNNINSIYSKEVPDVIFIKQEEKEAISKVYSNYFVLPDNLYDSFYISTTGSSCYDSIREMLYQNLNYNTSITITCLPKYYIEPNNIIYIEDVSNNIIGNYQITQYTLPLTYNGTMSITATEVLTRV